MCFTLLSHLIQAVMRPLPSVNAPVQGDDLIVKLVAILMM